MTRKKIAAAILSLGCLNATSALALGLGELTLESFLNEPLQARVDLLNLAGLNEDQIRIKLATSEDFDRMGVDRAYFLASLKFEVIIDNQGAGHITVSSDDPVLEPYLDFIVEARWPSGRLLREYTVLVDPPTFDQSATVVSATQRVAEVEGTQAATTKKNSEPAAHSGTRVDVRNSNLAPGEMPEREYWSETNSSPTPGDRYMIRRDETLWGIASRAAPDGASVHQTMLDIQRLNPKAFLDGNINRIKAGYIIYLPSEGDIGEADQSAAISEVRQQNQEWREGRSSLERRGLGQPSLRISADPVTRNDADAVSATAGDTATGGGDTADGTGMGGSANQGQPDSDMPDVENRLLAMEQQLETLQRIVSLKDEQIAALQGALADASEGDSDASVEEVELELLEGDIGDEADVLESVEDTAGSVSTLEEAPAEPVVTPEPAAKAAAASRSSEGEEASGFGAWIYGLGALIIAALAFFLWRRRNQDEDEGDELNVGRDHQDVFADVQLSDPVVEVKENGHASEEPQSADVPDFAAPEEVEKADSGRGYGEYKHDEYASDVDAGDALAEADIYIAYGRYPQAVELLRTAIASEPNNPSYHLKLMEIASETGDLDELTLQHGELRRIGDATSLSAAAALVGESSDSTAAANPLGDFESTPLDDLTPPADLADDLSGSLEADFSGLEIESSGLDDDELDLSADFEQAQESNGEELVFATEGNEMSTKLDLARAYLDMGDGDGARQILEEVVAEGTDEQGEEARTLLARIG
jgi:pilus assembly protein FimV